MLRDTDMDAPPESGSFAVYGSPRYGRTPLWIFEACRDGRLSSTSALLYGWIMLRYSGMERGIFPSHKVLASEMGMTDRAVKKCLNSLRSCGALDWKQTTRESDGGQSVNTYRLAYIGPGEFGPDWTGTDTSAALGTSVPGGTPRNFCSPPPRNFCSPPLGTKVPTKRKTEVLKRQRSQDLNLALRPLTRPQRRPTGPLTTSWTSSAPPWRQRPRSTPRALGTRELG